MRVTELDWTDIKTRLKISEKPPLSVKDISESHKQSLLMASRIRFKKYEDNPLVVGLTRWIIGNLNTSIDEVLSWFIEFSEGDERAVMVWLSDDRRYIGVLRPCDEWMIRKGWYVAEWKNETPLP